MNYFPIQKSVTYIYYLIFTHLIALTSIYLITPLFLAILFSIWILILFCYYFFRDPKIIALEYLQKTQWKLLCCDHENVSATLLPSSAMMRYFLILHFQSEQFGVKKILLLRDQLSTEHFRALRRCMTMGYV